MNDPPLLSIRYYFPHVSCAPIALFYNESPCLVPENLRENARKKINAKSRIKIKNRFRLCLIPGIVGKMQELINREAK